MGGLALRATVVLNSTSNGASMRGFAITGSGEVVWACGATARLSRNTVFDAGDVSITASFGSDLTVTDNVIRNGWGALFCDTGTRVKARGNTFTGRNNAITIGHSSTIDGALVDLGTAADPGRNVIVGGSGGVGLFFMAQTSSIVPAAGNFWKAGVQGADAQGRYAPRLLTENVDRTNSNNYSLKASAGGGLQF